LEIVKDWIESYKTSTQFVHITPEGWDWLMRYPTRMQAFAMTPISIGELVVEKLEKIERIGKGIEEKQ
jgi:hypothetical protein